MSFGSGSSSSSLGGVRGGGNQQAILGIALFAVVAVAMLGFLLRKSPSSDTPAPNSAAARFLLGRVAYLTGDRKLAEESFAEVLRLNPRANGAKTELARLNLGSGRIEAGVQFAREAIETQPGNASARILLVRGLIARRDLDRARAELAPLVRASPDAPMVRAMSGAILMGARDAAGARREFERALEKDPGQLDALVGLTTLDAQAGQLPRARARLTAQVQRTPDRAPLLIIAAQADIVAKDYAQAEERLQRAILADPSNQASYGVLAQTYLRQQKLDDARREFERIAARDPRSVGALTMIAIIFEMKKQGDDAEHAYRRVLEVDPTAPVAANNLAYRWADRNHNLEEALALARSAVERLKDNADALDTLGWVYYKQGRPDQAIPQFQASAQKNPARPLFQYHLGLAYLANAEWENAKKALEDALRLDPSFDGADEARRRLASLKSGRP